MNITTRRALGCAFVLGGITSMIIGQPASAAGPNEITGTVFRDANANGAKDAWEGGEASITVTATSSTGASVTATSTATGSYTLDTTSLGAGPYRLELGTLPAFLQPGPFGPDNKSTVVISPAGATVNFGVNNPSDYCQRDPNLALSCFQTGGNPTAYSTISLNNQAQSFDGDSRTPAVDGRPTTSTQSQVGNVTGGGYQRTTKTQYWAAYVKRHAPLGPAGVGGIYKITPGPDAKSGTADDVAGTYVDLNTLFPGSFGTDPRPSGFTNWIGDPTFDQVSRAGFGDLDVSEDGRYLYTVSLGDKRLYRIDTHNNPALTPTAADVTRFDLPAAPGCPASDTVPFGIGVQDGLVYVGSVCNAQTSNAPADLRAYVFTFNAATSTFAPAPVLNESLNYVKGCELLEATNWWDPGTLNNCPYPSVNTHWNPWRPTYSASDYVITHDWDIPQRT